MSLDLKPYDWAQDDRALIYETPRQKYLCPEGHECYQSQKYSTREYALCDECVSEDYDGRGFSKGLYILTSMCKKI